MLRNFVLLGSLLLMTSGCADAGCFIPETVLPKREAVMARVDNGQAGRDLMAAVFDGDVATATRLVSGDRRLALTNAGVLADLLSVAVSTCRKPMVEALLAAGVPADGPPGRYPPLMLALRADEPWFAETLLKAGASSNSGKDQPVRPLDNAIVEGSSGAVRMLIDYGARLDDRDSTGATPLQTALDSHRFAIAELLIARGADPWAADNSGGNLGWAVSRPSLALTDEDNAAHARLAAKLPGMGWPSPAPTPEQVRALAAAGKWPPARARS